MLPDSLPSEADDDGAPVTATPTAIDPDDLATTLRVLADLHLLDEEHPDFISVRHATARMFKSVKQERRRQIRAAVAENDKAVVAATATGAPDRIDDETRGVDLTASATGTSAGTLLKSRACYICKQHYTLVDAFYHQLCPECAALSHAKRTARTDLTGKRALLTGGRAKIGMHIALRLLRDGAHLTITTRFPRDAVRRFSSLPDSGDWLHRLRVVGIDLRDPAQVIGLADSVAAQGPLDILINNAAQTVRRSPGAYSLLAEAESQPLPDGPLPEMETFGHTNDPHPQALEASVAAHPLLSVASLAGTVAELAGPSAMTADELGDRAAHVRRRQQRVRGDRRLQRLRVRVGGVAERLERGKRTVGQRVRLGLGQQRVRSGGAADRLGGVVDEHVQRAARGDGVGQADHLRRVAEVDADDAQPVQPLGRVGEL